MVRLVRELASGGQALGALCTGAYVLAAAGLIDGYRSAISWENLPAVRERFPKVDFTQDLFVIDRGLVTCSSGTASIDLMLNIIHKQHGRRLALEVTQQFNIEHIRDDQDRQHAPLLIEAAPGNEVLLRAAAMMEASVDAQLSMEQLAEQMGLSLRQLERLFKRHLNVSPRQFFVQLRLRRARNLLRHTAMSVMEVTIACGFQSASHFCNSYRDLFGHSPSAERRQRAASERH